MPCHIFISGPIRPSELAVRKVILSIRAEFPDAITYLCTWTTSLDTSRIRSEVDHYLEIPEPDIRGQITVSTLTDDKPDCAVPGWPLRCYSMMYAVNALCAYAAPADDDIIVRVRTDSIFRFTSAEHRSIVEKAKRGYLVWECRMSGPRFNDWFGIATYANFRKGWGFSTVEEYNLLLKDRWNTEDVIRVALLRNGVEILPLDPSEMECFLLRQAPDGTLYEERGF